MPSKITPFVIKFCIFLVGVGAFNAAFAQCSTSGDPVSITGTNCPNVVISSNKSEVAIQSGAYVGTTAWLTNPALLIQNATVENLNNSSLIQGQTTNTSGIQVDGTAVVKNLNNASQINGALYAIQLTGSGSITTINNTGSIYNNGNNAIAQGIFMSTAGGSTSIGTINNSGAINGSAGAIYLDTASGSNTASIGTISNSGSINGGQDAGILVGTGSTVNVINNNSGGDIRTGACNGLTCYNSIRNWGTISTINNLGNIAGSTGFGFTGYGIENNGLIKTLNNAQSNLTYVGALPTNYNIIITDATSYGKLSVASLGSGVTNFGIDPRSSLAPSTTKIYVDVLSGIPTANISKKSGTYGGAFVTTSWNLGKQAGVDKWDLLARTSAVATPVVNGSSGQNLAKSITAAYTGSKDFMVNLSAAGAAMFGANQALFSQIIPTLTPEQAATLAQVHAEGYSSNMTIGLEQMAHIINTVMDRIHAPVSASPSTKVYQDDEGRYVWADAAAVKGTVNNNNNLSGFGYNLYDLIIGGDISRSKEGGYGVFAGTGTTSMTESQQVTQNFNTTNFYAGLYGARNFDAQVKLSGALGYMYGDTNANRSMPDVGVIAGSNATSSYKSNGVYGAAKLAKAYQAQDFTLSPFVGVSYSQLWMGGATEQNGNSIFNYGISSATAYTAVTFAGLDFIYPLLKGANDPLSLIGFYKLGYDWFANSNAAHSITATGPTGSFSQVGANMGPVSNMVGLGIQGGITKDVSARIGAVASFNTYGQEYGGGAELRFKF
ncbi:autotransporter domain-containing protein [Polynucleobacter sp. AP-Capit-er-40B-B4]|uniref:autotransporter outer membrane beta-barrel domain-containing protein n=1 Tax=Polynucleobacter sp. AP-Capit-er-40B-B4 TaxID=2576927 RepID=UPI001C0DB762|nr:autotransporter outer membrane beta-barrel domain-containing protein [Polynucleobacter sp. AP-Capit-er-40B-B4]MBU3582358.1 autotransporter domain-containing protein [Polynucleobacter sp. AP-Capit-er-40B-B4]